MDGLNYDDYAPITPGYRFGTATAFARSLPLSAFVPPSNLSERRPSLPLSPVVPPPSTPPHGGSESGLESAGSEAGTFYGHWQIKVKQPVGNMSISPANRDVVLGARQGLFIIDLDHPFRPPRFLPQGGTWEVADVQWNPHPSHANLIVSTSSQKLLIWDLYKTGQTSISLTLNAHYRAITDVNWSPFEPDLVASCGIDSWIWAWDLRRGEKPVFGLSAWDSPATQVKWNRQDRHLLASSHDGQVLIWDDRKGSVPLTTIQAHSGAKIYGIDWSREVRNEIVTCSLDKTIKFWTIDSLSHIPHSPMDRTAPDNTIYTPRTVIHTKYPVWRARHLPFGQGVLSLAQRGQTALEMYHEGQPEAPVWKAEGHLDVVKEYVWRSKGGENPASDDREFQLITWSKDHTLRLWPITLPTLQAAGHTPGSEIKVLVPRRGARYETFHQPPKAEHHTLPAMVSAPAATRRVSVRRERADGSTETVPDHLSDHPSPTDPSGDLTNPQSVLNAARNNRPTPTSGYMTRGQVGTRKPRGIGDQMEWILSVKSGRKDGSMNGSGGVGGIDSESASRLTSRSRGGSVDVRDSSGRRVRRSGSRSVAIDHQEKIFPEHLADEITMISNRFGTRVKCEKCDVPKRTCTFHLLGPWGDKSAMTFIRIHFSFPKDYWKSLGDRQATAYPLFDLENIMGISSLNTRAFLLKKLREIRTRKRPCLEACLGFLLGEREEDSLVFPFARSEGSGSDDDSMVDGARNRSQRALQRQRDNNINKGAYIRPRRSQGIFGPNGELVCFFISTPVGITPSAGRRNTSPSPSIASRGAGRPSIFSSTAGTISHAVRGLAKLANDERKTTHPPEERSRVGLRFSDSVFMTSLPRSLTRESRDTRTSGAKVSLTISTLSKKIFGSLTVLDRNLGASYIIHAENPASRCYVNAKIAAAHGRPDHVRIWTTLYRLFSPSIPGYDDTTAWHQLNSLDDTPLDDKSPYNMVDEKYYATRWGAHPLAMRIITQMYDHLVHNRDVQMLAMLSLTLFEIDSLISERRPMTLLDRPKIIPVEAVITPANHIVSRVNIDYFSLRPREPNTPSPHTPSTSWQLSSLTANAGLKMSFSPSRVSSIFSSGPKRERTASNATTSAGQESPLASSYIGGGFIAEESIDRTNTTSIPVPGARLRTSESPKRKASLLLGRSKESPPAGLKSWSDSGPSPARISISVASAGHKRLTTLSGASRAMVPVKEKKKTISVVYLPDDEEVEQYQAPFVVDSRQKSIYEGHIIAYAEILFRWQLTEKRAELLKGIGQAAITEVQKDVLHRLNGVDANTEISLSEICPSCNSELNPQENGRCVYCDRLSEKTKCSICRLPVKGIAHTCLACRHISHFVCWRKGKWSSCPAGCGCRCQDHPGNFNVDISMFPITSPAPYSTDLLSPSTESDFQSPDWISRPLFDG